MMADLHRLVIGTTNAAKLRELRELLEPHGFEIKSLSDFPQATSVEEDGDTFAANARKKAVEHARSLNAWVMADDSGIEVQSLSGRPGVYSARFAGELATDGENNARLLVELGSLPPARRGARYVCHIAVANPSGEVLAESEAFCSGRIAFEPAGSNGFGYDPLFEVVEYHQTFGQLGPRVKAAISHRARALRMIVPQLLRIACGDRW
jgi:XTP/dITP diphosphohydrolase